MKTYAQTPDGWLWIDVSDLIPPPETATPAPKPHKAAWDAADTTDAKLNVIAQALGIT